MPRGPRGEFPGAIHHVVPQGNGRRRIVEDDHDRIAYVTRHARISRELGWLTHASCLMDTHHHAVVETPEPNLAIGMRRMLGGHARWLNARHQREGSVFRQHFWSRRIDDEGWFLRACLYVVLNPVAAGLCPHPREWPWCTYRVTAEGDPDRYMSGEGRLLTMFGDTPREARSSYATLVGETAGRIRDQRWASGPALWRSLEGIAAPRIATLSD